jgi:hypothetical protein
LLNITNHQGNVNQSHSEIPAHTARTAVIKKVKNNSKYEYLKKNSNVIMYEIYGNKIRIFGKTFINNNKNKIKLEIEDKEYELMGDYKINNRNNKQLLEVKIKGIENVTNMGYMFYGCSSLKKENIITQDKRILNECRLNN